ncbi:DUF1643 domain-containing protein [Sphingomonas sp. ZT3P38]|uniref:DUF1643 domain-containing protein n=1 Tax=Parasphingomonas zepuensis TaxID=3096161 RepID=UPI002FCA8960
MSDYLKKGATISACGRYRYHLWREWRGFGRDDTWTWWTDSRGKKIVDGAGAPIGDPKSVLFVMLNPSTADGTADDPTIRRCVSFAKSWGYDRMEVVNLFAWRATEPRDLLAMTGDGDPIGPENKSAIQRTVSDAGLVVCAWGAHGGHIDQDETVMGWIEDADGAPHALRLTKDGYPSHPLYLPAILTAVPYAGRRAS